MHFSGIWRSAQVSLGLSWVIYGPPLDGKRSTACPLILELNQVRHQFCEWFEGRFRFSDYGVNRELSSQASDSEEG
jgi:hypothetical protein